VEAQERQIRDNEQARSAITERSNGLTRSLREREVALSRAEEQIQTLTGRIGKLEADMQVNQAAYDKRIEELNAALHRERMERSVVEGALESSRRDTVRMQREQGLDGSGRRGTGTVAVMEKPAKAEATEDEAPPVQTIPGPSVQPDRT
jgi:predicted  nucleic acid-binding Zn-ribbon protein